MKHIAVWKIYILIFFQFKYVIVIDFNLIDPEKCLIEDRKFLCHDHKKCISVEHVCNNNTDCLDASDEGGLCNNVTGLYFNSI